MATLDAWGWARLAFGVLFAACYLAWLATRGRREGAPSPFESGWPAAASAAGVVLLVLSGSLPVPEAVSEVATVLGGVLILAAIAGHHLSRGGGPASDGPP